MLGRGGTAEVWKAFDTQLQRYVAIKLLHADLQADPDFIKRFTREAQLIAALHHPNIVQIYDFHITEIPVGAELDPAQETIAYMVMDYVQGQTLAHYLYRTSHQKQFPSAAQIVRLFTPISLALDYAHQHGMIHRDIKPANILLDSRHTARNPMGEPILSDFGLAKLLTASSQTASGSLFGTPLYISPEQVQNRPVCDQTDIYSLGVVLYEMLTGGPPFQGESLTSIMMQHLTEVPVEPHLLNPDLPPTVSELLLKSLAKDPLDRFSSASSMTAALAEALDLPVPEDLKQAISSTDDINISVYQTPASKPPAGLGSPRTSSDVAVALPSSDGPISEQYTPTTLPPIKAEAVSRPFNLPDSEVHLVAPEGVAEPARQSTVTADQQPIASAQTPPGPASAPVSSTASSSLPPGSAPPILLPAPAPSAQKRRWLPVALVAALIVVLVSSGLGTLLLLTHHNTAAPVGTTSVVGRAFFASSGQLNQTTTQGSNDQLQIDLQNIPNPQASKSYYAWLLGDKSQSEAPPILLGKLMPKSGVVHFFYAGNSHHSNLLQTTSRFLITEEDANTTPGIPSPDLTTWRYYAELPQTAAPGQTYSLLDHLRHLLASDPTLEALHLPGGLNIWAYRNTQKLLEWAGSARDDWNTKDVAMMHQQIVSMLDYLDGEALVQQDVPPGTPALADRQIAQVGLLEFDAGQTPPGYLYHIALHLNGVLTSPGTTQDQRQLAIQINTGISDVKGWLEQVHRDAVQLVRMNDAQLAQPSSLALLNDMVAQANNAYMGRTDSSTGQLQMGIAQIYQDVQRLAAFEVKVYK